MIRCPQCKKVTKEISYRGPVLFVEGTARIDESGGIIALGPAKATLTIKIGQELQSTLVNVQCPNCQYSGPSKTFTVIRASVISDKEATTEFVTSFGARLWIAEDEEADALRIFSAERAQWQVPLPEA